MQPLSTSQRALLFGLLSLCLLLAWHLRFVQDDAFISLRYAAHLVAGQGLVFNPGEYVEGYSNFLWTMILAVPLSLGLEPIGFTYVLGIFLLALNLGVSFYLARWILNAYTQAIVVVLLLGTHYSFSAYATGGLETQLQSLLFTTGLALSLPLLFKTPRLSPLFWFSIISALAVLTRLDSVVFFLPLGVALGLRVLNSPQRGALFSALLLPAGTLLSLWLVWKFQYYGDVLPNTYYAKVAAVPAFVLLYQGFIYLASFFISYWLWPVGLLALAAINRHHLLHPEQRPMLVLSLLVFLWLLYVLKVGGDFMEFRFLIPVLPAGMLLSVWLIYRLLPTTLLRYALLSLLLIGSLNHAQHFTGINGINSIADLRAFMEQERADLAGQALGALFADAKQPVHIATVAAGAIPYYSDLKTLDMFGLNEPQVARQGIPFANKPGHYRLAPLNYLQQQTVHLVLGVPRFRRTEQTFTEAYGGLAGFLVGSYILEAPFDANGQPACDLNQLNLPSRLPSWWPHIERSTYFCPPKHLPAQARILEIPLDHERLLTLLYLNPHPAIEAAIQYYHFPVYPIRQ